MRHVMRQPHVMVMHELLGAAHLLQLQAPVLWRCKHVLNEQQAASGAQHPGGLCQRCTGVRHRAQHLHDQWQAVSCWAPKPCA
jgi:hypothetical protein